MAMGEVRRPTAELAERTLNELTPDMVQLVHATLLAPTFRPEELMTQQEIAEAYGPDGTDPSCVLLDGDTPVGVMLGEWYADRRVLLLAYMAMSPDRRGQGLGARLLHTVLPRWCAENPGALVLAEVDDPRRWPVKDGIDPESRLRFYARHGAHLIPVSYFQPSLRAGSARVRGMFLIRLDQSPALSEGVLVEFLAEYFTVCEGSAAPDDPEVAELLRSASALDLHRDTWPLSRWSDMPTAS